MRPMRDPAPSRIAYRMNRLMLTPGFRVFLRYGLPVLVVLTVFAAWYSDETRRDKIKSMRLARTAVRIVGCRRPAGVDAAAG